MSSSVPRRRRWLAHPAPYVAALLALAIVSPVFVWNAEHGWVSFRFQGGRGAPDSQGSLLQALGMMLGEIAYLTPWIFAGLAAAAMAAFRDAAVGRRQAPVSALPGRAAGSRLHA